MKTMSDEISLDDLNKGLETLKFSFPENTVLKLVQYIDLLHKWNQIYNLTAIRNKSHMLSHHIFDSLSVLTELEGVNSLIDVGSGGGMPGIPIAIARPDLAITLLDSNSKKAVFLTQAKIELGLDNVTVKQSRVEVLQGVQFEVIISRAFAELSDFVSITKQLLLEHGYWLAMKGIHPYEEISRLPSWVLLEEVKPVNVPGIDAQRHLVRLSLEKGY